MGWGGGGGGGVYTNEFMKLCLLLSLCDAA
jgi:hypothetical protein